MPTHVHTPSLPRRLFDSHPIVEVDAQNVTEMVIALDCMFPGIGERLIETKERMRRYVNIFVSQGSERVQADANTLLSDNSEAWIVPNVAGGCPLSHPPFK